MNSETIFQLHLDVDTPQINPVELLVSRCQLSKQLIKKAMRNGSVWLTRNKSTYRLRRAKKPLLLGDKVHFYYNSSVQEMQPIRPILIEDKDSYSIWHKPRGMFSQGSKWGDHCSIARWIETNHSPQRPTFTIHRLDRATSGIILVAHTKRTATLLSKQFEDRLVKKHYLAISTSPLKKHTFTIRNKLDGKKAISHFQLIEHQNPYLLFDINIETGRKHQIRKHLANEGMPILGDRLYGDSLSSNTTTPDLQLTAYKITFLCPIEKKTKTMELPKEFKLNIKSLL